ncbi:30S ribosomal S1 domain protein [Rickettsia hoogstraalii str. RCCE3]|nr:30S ribosomal S1 domain protein [Rickettsia hoogstraalii str. RCCE3]
MSIKKQRFVPQLAAINHEFEEDFSKMLETVDTSHIKEKTVVKGQVIEIKTIWLLLTLD